MSRDFHDLKRGEKFKSNQQKLTLAITKVSNTNVAGGKKIPWAEQQQGFGWLFMDIYVPYIHLDLVHTASRDRQMYADL